MSALVSVRENVFSFALCNTVHFLCNPKEGHGIDNMSAGCAQVPSSNTLQLYILIIIQCEDMSII